MAGKCLFVPILDGLKAGDVNAHQHFVCSYVQQVHQVYTVIKRNTTLLQSIKTAVIKQKPVKTTVK